MFYIGAICNCVIMSALSLRLLNYFQQEGYKLTPCCKERICFNSYVCLTLVQWVTTAAIYVAAIMTSLTFLDYVAVGINALTGSAYAAYVLSRKMKVPLRYTPRVIRLLITLTVMYVCINIGMCAGGNQIRAGEVTMRFVFLPLGTMLTLPCIRIAAIINAPCERIIKNYYISRCIRKLEKMPYLVKIGITGSYGKTGVKDMIAIILGTKYKVYATPASYNTPMGICKAVSLMPADSQYFICEMGARHSGDIAQLCGIVRPKAGVITGIAPQHMKTFGCLQNIINTKNELIGALPADGIAVFNCTGEYVKDMYRACGLRRKICVDGVTGIRAENIVCDENGSTFDLTDGKETYKCAFKLIGRHNVENLLTAAAMCREAGMTLQEIAAAVSLLKAVPHRLEVMRGNNGVTIIDDGYNSNPCGARAAVDALQAFSGRKVIAAQGLVETGGSDYRANYELGVYMADKTDIAILIGRNAIALREGLLSGGYSEKSIYTAGSLTQAQELFPSVLMPGDVLLIENDLTDNY